LTPVNAEGSSGLLQGSEGIILPRGLASQIADKVGSVSVDLSPVTSALQAIKDVLIDFIAPTITNVTNALGHQSSISSTLVNIDRGIHDLTVAMGSLGQPFPAVATVPSAQLVGGGDTYILNIDGTKVADDDLTKEIFNRASQLYRARGVRHRTGIRG
jgi:hypothetical protein